MTEVNLINLAPYLFLLLAVLFCLANPRSKIALFSLIISFVIAFFTKTVQWPSLIAYVVAPASLFIWINHYFADLLRKFGFLVFVFMGYLMVSHNLPEVNNLKIFDQIIFGPGSAAFDMFLNYDKVFLALIIFMLHPKMDKEIPFKNTYWKILKYYVLAIIFLAAPAVYFGYIQFQPSTNPFLLLWAVNNLFFVCFAEEVIFRRFFQTYLVNYFRNTQYGDLVAVFLASLVFGFAHWNGGWAAMGLATVAGVFYGLCFYHTNNVRSSMTLHFMVNLTHAILFTYPYAV